MDLTITPPHGYHEVANARWTWADPNCVGCTGTGTVWTDVWDHEITNFSPIYREPDDCDCVWMPDEEILEELDRRYRSWGNAERARDAWKDIRRAIGPRRSGGWYWSGYWRAGYTVISIDYFFPGGDPSNPAWQMTIRWDDGHHTAHCTAWDTDQDSCHRPAARHPGPAPELDPAPPASGSRRSLWSLLTSWFRSHH